MYIIKNRITGEYDRRGCRTGFHKIERSAWNKIGHAKAHVIQKIKDSKYAGRGESVISWYVNADFIELTESGAGKLIPVSDFLDEYYKNQKQIIAG